MRVFSFANNEVGMRLVGRLTSEPGVELVGVCVIAGAPRWRDGIVRIAKACNIPVFDETALDDADGRARIAELGAELAFSLYYPRILKREAIALFKRGIINVHPSLLPYNRGSYTPTWIILDGTPAGATLHYIDEGVDSGPIIAQRPVKVEAWDTGETLNRKLVEACCGLFIETLSDILADNVEATPQPAGLPPRRKRDVDALDRLDLNVAMPLRWVIDILRARTFDMYPGCYFEQDGRKVYVKLKLEPEGV